MNRFIELDGHPSSCTFAVLSEKGKTIRTDVVETNGIAAITLAMWKNKEAYDPAKHQKKAA